VHIAGKAMPPITQLCREELNADPFSGFLLIFRSRNGTAIRILQYELNGVRPVRLSEPVAEARGGVKADAVGVDALELPRDAGADRIPLEGGIGYADRSYVE
jgi:hypothetical protein